MRSAGPSKRARAGDTAPRSLQLLPPSREYCQRPVPLLPMIARATFAPASGSLTVPASTSAIRSPAEVPVNRPGPLRVGASLIGRTIKRAFALIALNAVEPPVKERLRRVATVPDVRSQAW